MRCSKPQTIGKRVVPCGKCGFCLQTKREDWTFRLTQELRFANSAAFLTMTYEDDPTGKITFDKDHLPRCGSLPISEVGIPELRKRDVQLFMKRLRKEHAELSTDKVRFYAVGEYGTKTDRPHYHVIIFNLDRKVLSNVLAIWSHGHVHVGSVSMASIHYTTKYVINKAIDSKGREPPFSLMSRRPGIGAQYLVTHTEWHRVSKEFNLIKARYYAKVNGIYTRLPRYYKDRIFTDAERELLAEVAILESKKAITEEIARISAFHDDPYYHYSERILTESATVKSKSNQLNKF